MPLKEKEKGQKGHIHWKSQHALCRFQAWDGLTHFYTRSNTSLSRKLTASRLFRVLEGSRCCSCGPHSHYLEIKSKKLNLNVFCIRVCTKLSEEMKVRCAAFKVLPCQIVSNLISSSSLVLQYNTGQARAMTP